MWFIYKQAVYGRQFVYMLPISGKIRSTGTGPGVRRSDLFINRQFIAGI